jgi:hypothetical protein
MWRPRGAHLLALYRTVRIAFALQKSKSTEIFLGAFAGTQALKLFVTVTVDFSLFSHASAF